MEKSEKSTWPRPAAVDCRRSRTGSVFRAEHAPGFLGNRSASSIACSPASRSPALARASASSLRNIGSQSRAPAFFQPKIPARIVSRPFATVRGAPTPVSERKRAAHSGHASNHREGFLDEWPNCHAAPPGRSHFAGCNKPISHTRTAPRGATDARARI